MQQNHIPSATPRAVREPPVQKTDMTVVEIVAEEHTQLTHRYESKILRRRSIRLKRYDYKRIGAYFVTIATRNRESRFGDIIDGEVHLNDTGRLVKSAWEWLTMRYAYVELDTYVVMPNHLHGIIDIFDQNSGNREKDQALRKPLGRLIGAFKTVSTRRVNNALETPGQPLWQRNYYERVIRNDEELDRVREYIVYNPMRWDTDSENPNFIPKHNT